MAKIVSVEEALAQIKDNDTVAIQGSGGGVCEPTFILKKLGEKYCREKSPKNLTLLHANGIGDRDTYGTDALAYPGLVKGYCRHWGMAPKMAQLALEEKSKPTTCPRVLFHRCFRRLLLENRESLQKPVCTPS